MFEFVYFPKTSCIFVVNNNNAYEGRTSYKLSV